MVNGLAFEILNIIIIFTPVKILIENGLSKISKKLV